MKGLSIRMADEHDAGEVLSVYAPFVANTVITFEYEVPDIVTFRKRMKNIQEEYPYLVCTKDGKIVGYAYASRHKERAAYQWNAELSVYVAEEYHGIGIGKALYASVIEILRAQNVQNVYGCVTTPNIKSEALHRCFGFQLVGVYHGTGYKFGRWLDVAWFEKHTGAHETEPMPFKKIGDIEKEKISSILLNAIT